MYQKDDTYYMTLEVILTKNRQASSGALFKQEQGHVVVDSVLPHSMASRSGLKPGDIVLSIENKTIVNVPQVRSFFYKTNLRLSLQRKYNTQTV